jgi:Fur family peroxide stress response transcriptional regulator
VPSTPPTTAPRRRNRTPQRDRLLAYLRDTDTHPTAAQIHDAIGPDLPGLSLATIYRNLEVLVDEGLVDEVSVPSSSTRYDGNPRAHHHFLCDRCSRIIDVELPEPRMLRRKLHDAYALRARSVSIDFHGLCPECEGHTRDA